VAALTIYLDNSVLVPLLLPDAFVDRAEAFLLTSPTGLIVSDFVSAEFASVIGIRLRTGKLTVNDARAALTNFDLWSGRRTRVAETTTSDIRAAHSMLRRLDLTLRAPDAINLAIAQRLAADLATFDAKMAASAGKLGIPVLQI
jgi:predicted nucleic acid-binding protein